MARRLGTVSALGRPHRSEVDYAEVLAARGYDVVLLGRDFAGADFEVDGQPWELKTLRSASAGSVRANLRSARRQCSRVVVDGRSAGLRVAVAVRAVRQSEHADRLDGLFEIAVECVDGRIALLRADETGGWSNGSSVLGT
jgi:hypothetical protein